MADAVTCLSLSGPRCGEPCPEGLWGPDCNLSCFKHCPNSDTCVRETGECVCRPGYWGVSCQNSECCSWLAACKNRGKDWNHVCCWVWAQQVTWSRPDSGLKRTFIQRWRLTGRVAVWPLAPLSLPRVRLAGAGGQRHGSPSAWWERLMGGHRGHRRAGASRCPAVGSAAAVPSQTERQAKQRTNRHLLHQPHSQLWVCGSRYAQPPLCSTPSVATPAKLKHFKLTINKYYIEHTFQVYCFTFTID